MRFQEESFEKCWGDVLPFLMAHHEEISKHNDFQLDPDVEKYRLLSDMGMYKVFTAKDKGIGGELIGYAGFFVSPMIHFKNNSQAVCDLIYVRPEHRRSGVGTKLIEFIGEKLKHVDVIYYNIPAKMDWSGLLIKKGYELHDRMYSRRN
jgi:GNAT superfamily N-acetyltransferase